MQWNCSSGSGIPHVELLYVAFLYFYTVGHQPVAGEVVAGGLVAGGLEQQPDTGGLVQQPVSSNRCGRRTRRGKPSPPTKALPTN